MVAEAPARVAITRTDAPRPAAMRALPVGIRIPARAVMHAVSIPPAEAPEAFLRAAVGAVRERAPVTTAPVIIAVLADSAVPAVIAVLADSAVLVVIAEAAAFRAVCANARNAPRVRHPCTARSRRAAV